MGGQLCVVWCLIAAAAVLQCERYPISFKSRVNGRMYRHIVLAIKYRVRLLHTARCS